MNSKMINFFQQPRYKINQVLLRLIGQWPYQNKIDRCLFFAMTVFFCATLLTAQIRKDIIDSDDSAVIIESIPPLIVQLGCIIKMVTCIVHADKLKYLLQCIEDDWNSPMGPEVKVLARFSDDGRKFGMAYAMLLYCSSSIFLIIPFAPKFIVACGWANLSTAVQFPIPVDYFVDTENNWVYIQIHLCLGIFFVVTIYNAIDALFVMLVQHASGIFSAIGYRFEHLVESDDLDIDLNPPYEDDESYWIVIDCVKKHKAAVEFVDKLAGMYSGSFLLMVLFNIPVMSFSGLQVMWSLDRPTDAIRHAMFTACELLHLFFECYFSQRLTDHSLRVFECLSRTQWYMTSMRTRKLINFAMTRSKIPIHFKAGNLYTMSMENFSSVVRTSMSYFTLLCSM